MAHVVTLTPNPALDVSTAVADMQPGVKLRCEPARTDPGGGGINAARAIARLGGAVTAVYCSGGPVGRRLEQLLEHDRIEQRVVRIAGETRESFAVLDEGSGERYRFLLPGPRLTASEWRRCVELTVAAASGGGYVLASGSLPRGVPIDGYARLARAVRAGGGRLVLDTAGAALEAALRAGVHLIKPNWREFDALAGERELSDAERRGLAEQLVRDGATQAVIVTLGARGAALTTAEGTVEIAAPPVEVVSAVGGGDSFGGALTLALARGWSLEDACRLGVAAAAAAVTTPGTEPPQRAEIQRHYRTVCAAESSGSAQRLRADVRALPAEQPRQSATRI